MLLSATAGTNSEGFGFDTTMAIGGTFDNWTRGCSDTQTVRNERDEVENLV
jgi:hypothetical protein